MTIKEYLEKSCLKHGAFAKKCGLEKSTFSRYMNGSRKLPLDVFERIKKASGGKITRHDNLAS